jgi:hypothetical protein
VSAVPERTEVDGVLITGIFGVGKSSVVAEIADLLEAQDERYAAIDLDWLTWADTGDRGNGAEHRMLLTNLSAVVGNYLEAGVRRFAMARSLRDRSEVESLRAAIPVPVRIVRLTVSLEEVERRLRADVTRGREDDLREAGEWAAAGLGEGFEDLAVANDRPIREVATEIVRWLGWARTPDL